MAAVRRSVVKMDCVQSNNSPAEMNGPNQPSHNHNNNLNSGNNNNNNRHKTKLGLLIRTPRRRRAHCESQRSASIGPASASMDLQLLSKSWDGSNGMLGSNNPGKSTWSGWRSLRKISDTLIDYALNEPYKVDSVFDDELPSSEVSVYRPRKCDVFTDSATGKRHILHGSKTLGHAQGRNTVSNQPHFHSAGESRWLVCGFK